MSLPVVARRNSGYFAHNLDESLLVDEELADQVWGAWDAGEIHWLSGQIESKSEYGGDP